jgi:hypothetical protein
MYEAEKGHSDPELVTRARNFDSDFLQHFAPIFDAVGRAVIEERSRSQWLVDNDVIEVYKSLATTLRTLSSGIYYESLPSGPIRISLFRCLKSLFDEFMQPRIDGDRKVLKVSEAVLILEFLTLSAEINSSLRPKSRQYLDWISTMVSPAPQEQLSGLILPGT